jgi:hypothetical protein
LLRIFEIYTFLRGVPGRRERAKVETALSMPALWLHGIITGRTPGFTLGQKWTTSSEPQGQWKLLVKELRAHVNGKKVLEPRLTSEMERSLMWDSVKEALGGSDPVNVFVQAIKKIMREDA